MSATPRAILINAAETRGLRRVVLRPGQPPDACIYPGDDAPDTFHLGISDPDPKPTASDPLIAVASFYREPLPDNPAGLPQLRIRGMAVLPEHRNRGLGRALIHAGLDIARDQSPPPALAWCNARTTACAYYEKLGFTPRGDEFEIKGIGPHFVMVRPIELRSRE